MKKIIYLFAIITFAFIQPLSAQDVLNKYLTSAAENNAGLKAQFNTYYASLEKVKQVGTLPDPTISFAYFILPIETKVGPQIAKISMNQMFPWFGTLDALENSAESLAKAKYDLFEEAKSKLFYDVKLTYYNLYFTQKAIKISSENITILQSFQNLAKIKVESGSGSAVDIYRVEMELNDLENQLALLKDNKTFLSVKFNRLLNVADSSSISIIDTLKNIDFAYSKSAILSSIERNNHVLASFNSQIEALKSKEVSAVKEGMPKVSLGMDYTFIGESGKDAFIFPKIGMSVPLYRTKYKAKVQEVVFLQKAKSEEKTNKVNHLATLFESAWKDYLDASRRIELYTKQQDLAKKSLSILETQYSTNKVGFEEILRIERKLLKYSLELQKATSDKAAALAFINYLQGQ